MAVLLLFFTEVIAKTQLPELSTKQQLTNLRYISADGKVSYFQNNSGKLIMTTMFKNFDILNFKKYADFQVFVSQSKKKILVEVDSTHITNLDITKNNDIYLGDFSGKEVELVGSGTSIKLHLLDNYSSYFEVKKGLLHILNNKTKKELTVIQLRNNLNPFFIPSVVMTLPTKVLYTDINKDGLQALLEYDLVTGKFKPIHKAKASGVKLETCFVDDKLVVGEFSHPSINRGSSITYYNVTNGTLSSPQLVYSSSLEDIGNMHCLNEKEIYFIKTFAQDSFINYNKTDVAQLNLLSKDVTIKSDLLKATQIYAMDDRILIPYQDKTLVVTGSNNLDLDKLKDDRDFQFIKNKKFNDALGDSL